MTFPGVQIPPPPQLVLALTAWMQGKILEVMGETCDVFTVSAAGAAWMNQYMLQLGIILQPCLAAPDDPACCWPRTARTGNGIPVQASGPVSSSSQRCVPAE